MAIKLDYDQYGNIIAIDTDTGNEIGSVGTMGNEMAEIEEKRKLREKAKNMMEEKKHPKK